jgi:hypothetical protein
LASKVSKAQAVSWLLENGPRELESLFRAIVCNSSGPILIADNERNCLDRAVRKALSGRVLHCMLKNKQLSSTAQTVPEAVPFVTEPLPSCP